MIEGESKAAQHLCRLQARQADPDDLALIVSMLYGAALPCSASRRTRRSPGPEIAIAFSSMTHRTLLPDRTVSVTSAAALLPPSRFSLLSALSQTFALRALREQPLWRLLAADKAPAVLALLQSLLLDGDKTLPGSVLLERLTYEIDFLRAAAIDLPQTPQQYIADWLAQGWLSRRLPAGASEELFDLSADAVTAMRFVKTQAQPRAAATEGRLAAVTHQLERQYQLENKLE